MSYYHYSKNHPVNPYITSMEKFFCKVIVAPRVLHSFPTRRSSDLASSAVDQDFTCGDGPSCRWGDYAGSSGQDRKSTRLNSSHVKNSYAVFCLKKKKLPIHYLHDLKYNVHYHHYSRII